MPGLGTHRLKVVTVARPKDLAATSRLRHDGYLREGGQAIPPATYCLALLLGFLIPIDILGPIPPILLDFMRYLVSGVIVLTTRAETRLHGLTQATCLALIAAATVATASGAF